MASNPHKFWRKVNYKGPIHPVLGTRCWLWKGTIRNGGYGQYKFNGKSERAHRVAWFLTYGKWPELSLLHQCDTPACINPAHTFEGTQADNIADRVSKRRSAVGEHNGRSKLTLAEVCMIKRECSIGKLTKKSLAAKYKVHRDTISRISLGKSRVEHA